MHNMQHFCLTLSWPLYDLESRNTWSVIYMTILSLDLASTMWDKFNEPKIIKIGHLEAEILNILILGSKSIDLNRKNSFFHFSSYIATDSLRYVKFIKIHYKTMILGGIYISYPKKPYLPGSSEENVFLNRL